MTPDITVSDKSDETFLTVLRDGLSSYNDEKLGGHDRTPLTIRLTDPETGKEIGGIAGRTSLGLLFIDLVYLPKEARGTGLGSKLLAMAEAEGRRRGCTKAVLFTMSVQAPEFYKKLGWRVFGEIGPLELGVSRIWLTKEL